VSQIRNYRLGGNEFRDCEAPIGWAEVSLFSCRVEDGALQVDLDLRTPPARTALRIVGNHVESGSAAVDAKPTAVMIRVEGYPILVAKLLELEPDTVTIEALDLRPFGLSITADPTALKVGPTVLSGSTFSGIRHGVSLG
jgi:hypothetical protein